MKHYGKCWIKASVPMGPPSDPQRNPVHRQPGGCACFHWFLSVGIEPKTRGWLCKTTAQRDWRPPRAMLIAWEGREFGRTNQPTHVHRAHPLGRRECPDRTADRAGRMRGDAKCGRFAASARCLDDQAPGWRKRRRSAFAVHRRMRGVGEGQLQKMEGYYPKP